MNAHDIKAIRDLGSPMFAAIADRIEAEVERLRAERAELRRLLLVAYDALFFERGMTPQDRDAMRHALETIPREVTPIQTDP